jgi:hypothetical protein
MLESLTSFLTVVSNALCNDYFGFFYKFLELESNNGKLFFINEET